MHEDNTQTPEYKAWKDQIRKDLEKAGVWMGKISKIETPSKAPRPYGFPPIDYNPIDLNKKKESEPSLVMMPKRAAHMNPSFLRKQKESGILGAREVRSPQAPAEVKRPIPRNTVPLSESEDIAILNSRNKEEKVQPTNLSEVYKSAAISSKKGDGYTRLNLAAAEIPDEWRNHKWHRSAVVTSQMKEFVANIEANIKLMESSPYKDKYTRTIAAYKAKSAEVKRYLSTKPYV